MPLVATLYVHIPFRPGPRLYDDAMTAIDGQVPGSYVHAVAREVTYLAQQYLATDPISSIHVGGGRASLLNPDDWQVLFDRLSDSVPLDDLREVTLELHPLDATPPAVRVLEDIGITRISLEVLSFRADDLQTLQAPHAPDDIEDALDVLARSTIDDLSVDLMFGWQGQDLSHWEATLERVAQLKAGHVSLIEWTDDTVIPIASNDTVAEQYEVASSHLRKHGYDRYEISHFARPGHRSIHNERNLNHSNALGVGAGAHSFWWDELPAIRWYSVDNRARYEALLKQRHLPIAERRSLDLLDLANEYVLLRLRTSDGLDPTVLHDRYDLDLWAHRQEALEQLIAAGHVETHGSGRLRLTDRGVLLADAVTRRLLPIGPV